MRRGRGFTLLEVLIALAVLAISSLAVVSQTANSLRQLQRLEYKTTALWLAENQINRLRIAEQLPSSGSQSESIEIMGQRWRVDTQISTTSDVWLRKLDVSVSLDNDYKEVSALVSLTAYRGKY